MQRGISFLQFPFIDPAMFSSPEEKNSGLSEIFIPIPTTADSILEVSKFTKPSVKIPATFFSFI